MKTVKLCALLMALSGLSAAYGLDVKITDFNRKNDGQSTFSLDVAEQGGMQTMSVAEYEYTVLGKMDLADGLPWTELSVTVGTNLRDIPLNNIKDGKEYRFFKVGVRQQSQVTFYSDIGVVPSPEFKSVFVDRPYGSLATTSHSSYTFAGWWSAATTGTQVLPATTVVNPESHNLYARWAYLGAPDNAIITDSGTVTVPAAVVSPAGAGSLAFDSYTVYASGGRPLPPGFSFNPGTRVITVAAGTTVGRYELYTTVAVSGTVPALLLTSPSFTVEVRQNKSYFCNELSPGTNEKDWTNRAHALRGDPSGISEATGEGTHAWTEPAIWSSRVFYIQRRDIGLEQPANARAIGPTLTVRLSRPTNGSNYFTLLHRADGKTETIMDENAWNPSAVGDNVWSTVTRPATLSRGSSAQLQVSAYRAKATSVRFRFAWARYDVLWAPPATGITY